MNPRGITAAGGFLPQTRLERADIFQQHSWALPGLRGKAKGRRSVANWDQDAITMGVEALRNCGNTSAISQLSFASTSHPFKDRSSSAVALAALALPATVLTSDLSCNRRAGTSALLQALLSQQNGTSAILCGEKRAAKAGSMAEILWGDGAAAVIIGDDDPIANLLGWHSCSEDLIDFYTADGFAPYPSEERWVKEKLYTPSVTASTKEAMESANVNAEDIHWAILPAPASGSEKSLARAIGLSNAKLITQSILASAGDLGSALPLYGLAVALEQADDGELILLSCFGNGCDSLVLRVNKTNSNKDSINSTTAQLAQGQPIKYGAYASSRGLLNIDFGPRSERVDKTFMTVHERGRKDITGFIGGKTSADAPTQFPKTPIALDDTVMTDKPYIDVRLADKTATVVSFTVDHLIYTPEPPFRYGLVEFDCGARVAMEFVDVNPEGIAIGDHVSMKFRIKSIDRERGYRHYFWKAAPISTTNTAEKK